MPLIGTAGHVDHGKSTLILSLTGRDPDRWDEEKQRGLTIDLGFAWTTLPGGEEVSFVDVPGHERFLKNMLAGIEAIDVALFVVAADEGWMPQSEEHLAVLDLLEVERGVVALTKSDLVETDLLELAQAEVVERLAGTSLEGAEVVPVSGVTGDGIPRLVESLDVLIAQVHSKDSGRPRLWVDRSFSAQGAGTIVTGTLLGGSVESGGTVEVYPSGTRARIRGIQSHEKAVDSARPGSRVALNLSGIDRDEITRGDMVGMAGQWRLSSRFLGKVSVARYHDELSRRGAYQLHLGTAARAVRLIAIDANHLVAQLDEPLPISAGDRFILRDTGRGLVIAGGRVLDPSPARAEAALASAATIDVGHGPNAVANALLAIRGHETLANLEADSGGGRPSGVIEAAGSVLSEAALKRLSQRAVHLVTDEHQRHPMRSGLSIATLAERLGTTRDVIDVLIERERQLERIGPAVAMVGHEVSVDQTDEAAWESAREKLKKGLDVPALRDLNLDPELVHLKIRAGELVQISPDFAYLPDQIDQIKAVIGGMGSDFSVAEFRDKAGLSRKYAVPILEWADAEGLTVRRGDLRRVRRA